MCVAGIDAHATYPVIAIVSNTAQETFDFTDVFRKDEQGTWLYSSVNFNSKDAPA